MARPHTPDGQRIEWTTDILWDAIKAATGEKPPPSGETVEDYVQTLLNRAKQAAATVTDD